MDLRKFIEQHPKDRCFVCDATNVSDQHHIIPVEYDGPENGLTVPLCPSCHRRVHAEAREAAKGSKGLHVNPENYPDTEQRNRATMLADYILQAYIIFKDSGKSKADGARNIVSASFTNEELAILHQIKSRRKFSSQARLIKTLVMEEYFRLNQKR